jgi:transposase-like protein
MGKKSELSVSQRLEIVLMILRKEEPISVLARRYGVSETTLHRRQRTVRAIRRSSKSRRSSPT